MGDVVNLQRESDAHLGLPPQTILLTSNDFSLRFHDSSANLVFSVDPHHPTPFLKRLLADSSGNPLVSISRSQKKATWQGFRKDSSEEMFRVERMRKTLETETVVGLRKGTSFYERWKNGDEGVYMEIGLLL